MHFGGYTYTCCLYFLLGPHLCWEPIAINDYIHYLEIHPCVATCISNSSFSCISTRPMLLIFQQYFKTLSQYFSITAVLPHIVIHARERYFLPNCFSTILWPFWAGPLTQRSFQEISLERNLPLIPNIMLTLINREGSFSQGHVSVKMNFMLHSDTLSGGFLLQIKSIPLEFFRSSRRGAVVNESDQAP